MLPWRLEDSSSEADDLLREFDVGLVPRVDPGRVRQHPKVHCELINHQVVTLELQVRLQVVDMPLSYWLRARKIILMGDRLD